MMKKHKKRKNIRKEISLIVFILLVSIFTITSFYSKNYSNKKLSTIAKENNLLLTSKNLATTNLNFKINADNNIIESANDYSISADEVSKMISGTSSNKEKIVFLTFDDGPSVNNTPKILEILKENDVHATFFVIGNHFENNQCLQNIVVNELANGNAIGNHTFTHNLKTLYPNNKIDTTTVMSEIDKTNNLLKSIIGMNFNSRVFRLPGGYLSRVFYNDENLNEFNDAIQKKQIVSLDWDAESGDANPTFQMNVQKQVEIATEKAGKENHIIILMHDCGARTDTVKALPEIIKFYKERNYKFKVIKNPQVENFIAHPIDDVKNLDGIFPPLN